MRKSCEQIQENLKAYADGQTPFPERLAIRNHLKQCETCRKELREMEQISREIRMRGAEALDPALKARILTSLPDGPPPACPRTSVRPGWTVLSLAGGVSVAMLLVWLFQRSPDAPPEYGPSQTLSRNGAEQAAPVNMASDTVESPEPLSTLTLNTDMPENTVRLAGQIVEEAGGTWVKESGVGGVDQYALTLTVASDRLAAVRVRLSALDRSSSQAGRSAQGPSASGALPTKSWNPPSPAVEAQRVARRTVRPQSMATFRLIVRSKKSSPRLR